MPISPDHRPRIGYTRGAGHSWDAQGKHNRKWRAALERADAIPLPLPHRVEDLPPDPLEGLDGLLLTGGPDVRLDLWPNPLEISPATIEPLQRQNHMTIDADRDATELLLTAAALERDLPLLGVCRGCQVLDLALGGQLILDIPTAIPGAVRHTALEAPGEPSATHGLEVEPDSLLGRILAGVDHARVNSRHHQAVHPGGGGEARIVARCPEDGIVEGIEAPAQSWALGVQWHPEIVGDPVIGDRHLVLFRALAERCRERARGR